MGDRYNRGRGVDIDDKRALEYIKRSVEGKQPHAYFFLASLYEAGAAGLNPDLKEALKLADVAGSLIPEQEVGSNESWMGVQSQRLVYTSDRKVRRRRNQETRRLPRTFKSSWPMLLVLP